MPFMPFMPLPPFDPADCSPLERAGAAAAADRLVFAEIRDPADPAFQRAWDLLAAEFQAKGELEDADVLASFLRAGLIDYGDDRSGSYHILVAWDGDEMVGVRDCYVDIDRRLGTSLVSLAHCLVVPRWRRRGLAAVLRVLPLTFARALVRARAGRALPTLAVAEMEPVSSRDPATLVRLLAYGRSGFRVLDPRRLPYAQPEFRGDASLTHLGIPLLGVVRTIDIASAEGPTPTIPADIAATFPILFYAAHRRFAAPARVDACEAHALGTLRASSEPVALLPLPDGPATLDRLQPLLRSAVLPLFPLELRGQGPTSEDPTMSLRDLLAAATRA